MKKQERIYILFLVIGLPLLAYVFLFSKKQDKQYRRLDNEGVVDTAVVVRDFIGAKRKQYYEYVFYGNNNEKYNGFIQYSPSFGELNVGDSCLIRYLPQEPDDINEILKDDKNKIIKIIK